MADAEANADGDRVPLLELDPDGARVSVVLGVLVSDAVVVLVMVGDTLEVGVCVPVKELVRELVGEDVNVGEFVSGGVDVTDDVPVLLGVFEELRPAERVVVGDAETVGETLEEGVAGNVVDGVANPVAEREGVIDRVALGVIDCVIVLDIDGLSVCDDDGVTVGVAVVAVERLCVGESVDEGVGETEKV